MEATVKGDCLGFIPFLHKAGASALVTAQLFCFLIAPDSAYHTAENLSHSAYRRHHEQI